MTKMGFVLIKTKSILFANIEFVLSSGSQLITINKHHQPENSLQRFLLNSVKANEHLKVTLDKESKEMILIISHLYPKTAMTFGTTGHSLKAKMKLVKLNFNLRALEEKCFK